MKAKQPIFVDGHVGKIYRAKKVGNLWRGWLKQTPIVRAIGQNSFKVESHYQFGEYSNFVYERAK